MGGWNESCHGDLKWLIPYPDHKGGAGVRMNDGFALSLSEQRSAAGPIKQCALRRNSWGREGTRSLLSQSGSPAGLLLLLFLQEISAEAVEAVIHSSLLSGGNETQ